MAEHANTQRNYAAAISHYKVPKSENGSFSMNNFFFYFSLFLFISLNADFNDKDSQGALHDTTLVALTRLYLMNDSLDNDDYKDKHACYKACSSTSFASWGDVTWRDVSWRVNETGSEDDTALLALARHCLKNEDLGNYDFKDDYC